MDDGLTTAAPPWLADLRASLAVTGRCVYLQTASKGPLSEAVLTAMRQAESLAAREGPVAPRGKAPLLAAAAETRELLARLLGVSAHELCWTPNTSTGLRTVMQSLLPGGVARLIVSDLEHVTTRSLGQGLAEQLGCTLRTVATAGSDADVLARLASACGEAGGEAGGRTVMILSQVACGDGRRLPVAAAVALARRHGVISVIDGAQAVGQMAVDVAAIGADFYVGSGHKWLLGPCGLGYIHVHPDRLDGFNPNWLPSADGAAASAAARAEAGSVSWVLHAGLRAALEQHRAIGIAAIEAQVTGLARRLRAGLAALPGVALLGPTDPARQTGIVSFTLADWTPAAYARLVDSLYHDHAILIKHQPDLAALRVSLAAFNTHGDVDRVLRALDSALARPDADPARAQPKATPCP